MFRTQIFVTFLLMVLVSCSKKQKSNFENFGPINNYNSSIFPKDAEEIPLTHLNINGQLPEWLIGNLLQNGPGKFNIGEEQIIHWFDGLAYISSLKFSRNKILYQSAFLKTDQYLESINSQKIKLNGFAQNFGDPQIKHFSHDGQQIKTANANINIHILNDQIIALGETPLPMLIDDVNLDTISIFDYEDKLKKLDSWESAHMKYDPASGMSYNFYIDYGFSSAYVLYKIEAGTKSRILLARQRVAYPSYMHDFSITKNYIILTAYPLKVKASDLIKPKNGFINAHKWEADQNTLIYVFNKHNGNFISMIPTEAMFAFHHINAYEEDQNNVNLYLSSFTNADIIMRVGASSYKDEPKAKLKKLSINLKDKKVDIENIIDEFYELPTINPSYLGRKNQFFYAVSYNSNELKQGFGIIKYDINNNQVKKWQNEGMFAGEPLFIAKPNSEKEDEGVIISTIYDAELKKSFILVLDSLSMQEIARAYLPQAVPLGLHGKFMMKRN